MIFMSIKKTFIIFCLLTVSLSGYCQIKNFGSKAKYKPQPTYLYSVYGYYDVFGQIGIGFQHQITHILNFDYALYKLNNNTYMKNAVAQDDYYDYNGYGINVNTKFMISPLNRFYIGVNIGFQSMYHGAVAWEKYTGSGDPRFNFIEERSGYGAFYGVTVGNKICINKLSIEPFMCLGLNSVSFNYTNYYYHSSYNPSSNYPTTGKGNQTYLYANAGLKIGFSFKKNKIQQAIDAKFDELYIPKEIELTQLIKTYDFKQMHESFFLKEARFSLIVLNYQSKKIYKSNYPDTASMYLDISSKLHRIESLISYNNIYETLYKNKKDSLLNYFNSVDVKGSKYLKKAKMKTQRVNVNSLSVFNRYYPDTTNINSKIKDLYQEIDELILYGNGRK